METSRRITALKVQKRNNQRVNVYLDGEFAFGLARIVAAWLHVGQELSPEKINELQSSDTYEVAHQQALRFISYRQRSIAEVRRNLEEHKFLEEVIQHTLERLQRNSLVDDNRFARVWVENRSEFRPRSRKALQFELRRRGVEDETIAEAVESVDDESMAYQAALKYSRKLTKLDDWQSFRQKLSAFLGRRGFNYDVIAPTVRRVWEEQEKDTQDDALDLS
jgi:regulatory protein